MATYTAHDKRSSTPKFDRTDIKRFRPDLNSSINELQGMDTMKEQLINPDVDASLGDVIKEAIKSLPKISVNTDDNQSATPAQKKRAKEIDDVITTTVNKIVPVIIAAASAAMEFSSRKIVQQEKEKLVKMQQFALMNKFDNDRLEQYSRRETICFSGISSDVGDSKENLIEEVKKIAGALEVPIKSEDISVIHRAGKPGPGKSHPVLCKFVSRRTRDNLMKKHKMLKDKPEFKDKVYMNEVLTPLRAKLLAYDKVYLM